MIATVLFTDIVGSTERAMALGDRRWREILRAHHAVVREQLRVHQGQEIATAGDGFLSVFDAPSNALLCAAAIRDAVRELDLQIRCGIHMGEVEREDGNVGGIAVHIGARVAALAGPGEILVSATVRDAETGSDFDFEDRGRQTLKGVAGEWRIYALTGIPEDAAPSVKAPMEPRFWQRIGMARALAGVPRSRAIAGGAFALAMLIGMVGLWVVIQDRGSSFAPEEALAGAAPGVAVLPFSVQGEGLDAWREGAVDLVGSNIDGVAGLRAIDSRTLLARWHETVDGGREPDLATSLEIAGQTGARYALLGTVVALGRDLRLSADIYDVRNGKNLGQAQIEGPPDSVYMLVDRLSIEALKTILGRPTDDLPRVDLARITTASLPALRAYLEGEVLYRKADWFAAIDAYQRAVAADSTFALAWLRLSEAVSWLPPESRPEGDVIEPAAQAARYSHRLPEREAILVRANRAFIVGSMTMLESLKSATRRYPDDPELAYLLGEYYAHFDAQLLVDGAEARRTLDRAIELDPTFAPYYQHPIEFAFYHADSVRALKLLSTFESLAGGTFEARRYRLGAELAWGTPAEKSKALAALDTLRDARAAPAFLLAHPRFLETGLAAAEAAHREGDALPFVLMNLMAGRVGAVNQALREGEGLPGPTFDTTVLFVERMYGLPIHPDTLHAYAAADTMFPFFAAVLAAEQGRNEDVRALQESAAAFARARLEAGDTLTAGQAHGLMRAIEGFVLLRNGDHDAALAALVEGQRAGTGWPPMLGPNLFIRWRIADLLVDLGRSEEAIPWYRSFRNDPYAALELGNVYETIGRHDEAKEQYQIALAFWRMADPVLAPRIAEARQRLAALGFNPRG